MSEEFLKRNKNQVFTPDYIADFICEAIGINADSIVLDPTCGTGSFLEAALRAGAKKIHGIELEKHAYKMAAEKFGCDVEMGDMFDALPKLKGITHAIINPPYNAEKTKGLIFVKETADAMGSGTIGCILPMACAIGNSKDLKNTREEMMRKHTLKAVFSFPDHIFYPSASVNTCGMIWEVGTPNGSETFFGYYKNDAHKKKKNQGLVAKPGEWEEKKELWLETYRKKEAIPGLSAVRAVTADDEWIAEAWLETDYSKLTEEDFLKTLREYAAYLVKEGKADDLINHIIGM